MHPGHEFRIRATIIRLEDEKRGEAVGQNFVQWLDSAAAAALS